MRDIAPTINDSVLTKAKAAIRWCEAASNIADAKPWEYKLIPENAIGPAAGLKFIFGQAVKVE